MADWVVGWCQLADFVKDPVQRAGGMLALVDAYCLFNRARGTGMHAILPHFRILNLIDCF